MDLNKPCWFCDNYTLPMQYSEEFKHNFHVTCVQKALATEKLNGLDDWPESAAQIIAKEFPSIFNEVEA